MAEEYTASAGQDGQDGRDAASPAARRGAAEQPAARRAAAEEGAAGEEPAVEQPASEDPAREQPLREGAGGEQAAGEHPDDAGAPVPRVLCDVQALAGLVPSPPGALWRLAESGRQLDANLVHLPPGRRVELHTEPELDVLLLVVAGGGALSSPDRSEQLAPGALAWLPHGSTRSLAAGAEGLTYFTVHRRRPGMRIGHRPDEAGKPPNTP